MARIKYRVRGTKPDSPIYIRFSDGRDKVFEIKSGYYCNPEYFNNKTGEVREVAMFNEKLELQNNLNELENAIRRTFNSSSEFTKEWFETEVKKHHGVILVDEKRPLLTWVIEKFIYHKEYSSEDEVSPNTIKTYNVTLNRVVEFEKYVGKKHFIDEVGGKFKSDFVVWAKQIMKYQPQTYEKTLKQIKSICKYAKLDRKINIDDSILLTTKRSKSVYKKRDKLPPIFLTIQEIQKIIKFKGSDSLINARDWLIVSCYTACRVSDLMELSNSNLHKSIEGGRIIKYKQIKTGVEVIVPVLPEVEKILLKYNGFPRPISHQKYNDYIKDVVELSGINHLVRGGKMSQKTKRKEFGMFPKHQLVTSHIGRRSFATNYYGLISNHSIMQVTGHTTERQFLEYVDKLNEDHVKEFNNLHKLLDEKLKEDKGIVK